MLDGTYTGLKASIADYLNRSDLTAAIPDFIALAEAQISRRLLMAGPVRRMLVRADATISTEFGTVPFDFMAANTFYFTEDNTKQLQFCSPDQINEKKSNSWITAGKPKFFAVVGAEFQFFPAPEQAYAAELTYWQRLPALSLTNPTNWLLTINPDAYLYGALLQSAPYLKDDDRVAVWSGAFMTILADICAADKLERNSSYQAVPYVPSGTP